MPSSKARSMMAKAASSSSPVPKSAGSEPTPPKPAQPKPRRETRKPVLPTRRYCTSAGYSASKAVEAGATHRHLVPCAGAGRSGRGPSVLGFLDRRLRYRVVVEVDRGGRCQLLLGLLLPLLLFSVSVVAAFCHRALILMTSRKVARGRC